MGCLELAKVILSAEVLEKRFGLGHKWIDELRNKGGKPPMMFVDVFVFGVKICAFLVCR
jgi:hypothetical protein